MRRVLVVASVGGAVLLSPTSAPAQFWDKLTNPKIPVSIQHPPGLGLQVNKVAFGPPKGEAAEQFIEALTEHFIRANVEVLEREQLQTMLAEHNFSLSGYVDQTTAAEIGKIVGPAVLVLANIPRHYAQQKSLRERWKDGNGFYHVTHISRTQAFARGSVRAVDLASGRIFAMQSFQTDPYLENRSEPDLCCPDFPAEPDVLDMAMSQLVGRAQRLFLPWTERTELYFFDDKDCNLKSAHAFMKSGNVPGALQQSLANLEACKTNPKAKDKNQAHANHNVGMAYFASGDLDKALEYLNAAQQAKPADIHTEAIGECMRAKAEAVKMQQVEERLALDEVLGAKRRAEAATAAPPSTPPAGKTSATKTTPRPVKPANGPVPTGDSAAASDSAKGSATVEDRLSRLDALFKKGLITKPEYDKKKAELLKEL
jgi:tetratricopeptide (TPR) repeat protein